ncbi:glycosyltransferase [bacterium]|nr:glycosyltransferase [bacterium]
MPQKKVAIIYDWADTRYGGAEKVLLTLQQIYPQATLFTSFVEPHAVWTQKFKQVKTSFLQHWPKFIRRHKKWLAVFLPLAFEQFDLTGFELIISVTSFAAKGVLTKDNQLHICYLLTPTRFLYSHTHEYVHQARGIRKLLLNYLRRWDQVAATRPDYLIAISQLVASRTEHYYGRKCAAVIYPTIIDDDKNIDKKEKNIDIDHKFFLCVGRLTPYKHIHQVVDICGRRQWPLVIIGSGVQKQILTKSIDSHGWSHIKLLGNLDDESIKKYYQQALALVAPGLEDFGINILEANQAGTLVITHPDSGARELLTSNMARDLDSQQLSVSLETVMARVYDQGKTLIPSQKLSRSDFVRLWREKVMTYEKMFV